MFPYLYLTPGETLFSIMVPAVLIAMATGIHLVARRKTIKFGAWTVVVLVILNVVPLAKLINHTF